MVLGSSKFVLSLVGLYKDHKNGFYLRNVSNIFVQSLCAFSLLWLLITNTFFAIEHNILTVNHINSATYTSISIASILSVYLHLIRSCLPIKKIFNRLEVVVLQSE